MGFLVDVVLPLALAFIMLALGLGLTFDDFARVVRRPRDFTVRRRVPDRGCCPVVAFALASVWPMAPELALGLMIIAAAPGGVTSNILTAFARGDVAAVDLADRGDQPVERDHHPDHRGLRLRPVHRRAGREGNFRRRHGARRLSDRRRPGADRPCRPPFRGELRAAVRTGGPQGVRGAFRPRARRQRSTISAPTSSPISPMRGWSRSSSTC